MDIRLYSKSGKYDDVYSANEITDLVASDTPSADGVEVMAGKVVKFLLTGLGSDAFNPGYGGTALHSWYVHESHIPRITLELMEDINRCVEFLRSAENSTLSDDAEKLLAVYLRDVKYHRDSNRTRLDVWIEIVTTKNNRAIVSINSPER